MAGALASLQARQRTQVLHLLQVVVVLALAGKVFSCLVVTAPGATACMSQRRTTRSTPEHCVACALSADAHGGHPLPVPLLLREFHPTTRWWCEGWRTATCPVLCRSLTVSSDCGCAVAPCALVMRQTGGQRLPTQDCLLTRAYNGESDTKSSTPPSWPSAPPHAVGWPPRPGSCAHPARPGRRRRGRRGPRGAGLRT